MLLYSTTLQIKDSLTKDKFIQLVIKWNQSSPYPENIIQGINWNGERSVIYRNNFLSLAIEEYRNENIIAVRYEKREKDGAIWDTDYIMNFNSMELTIQLDRAYTEDAQMGSLQFSTPYFLNLLIDGGYVKDDNGIPVRLDGLLISIDNLSLLTDVINGQESHKLPIVYVSKTVFNQNPLNVGLLCKKLKGAAHVLIQEDKHSNAMIRSACDDKNEYHGGVGIYLPNGKHKRFVYRDYIDSDNILINKVSRFVLQYINAQKKPILSTWAGVNIALLNDKYVSKKTESDERELARQKAEREMETYIGAFDDDNDKLRRQIEELTRENYSLQLENLGLREKLSNMEEVPILFLGDEDEFYPGEIKEMILDAIAEKVKNLSPKSRRCDVLNDVIKNNDYQCVSKEREQTVKALFNDYKTLTGAMRSDLKQLGFEILEDGKHFKLIYFGDARYRTTIAKTGSDWREGKNIATSILKNMM